jgi:acyl dehydratase
MLEVFGRAALLASAPCDLGTSSWESLEQQRIDSFADATRDHAWIHVDVERARREMPGGVTIAHGFLSLSLLPHLLDQLIQVRGCDKAFNYGMEGLRFLAPVPCGSRIRLAAGVQSAEPRGKFDAKVVFDCRVEIEHEARPALVAKWIALYLF